MKLKALSHYDNDVDTRFGDCILLYNDNQLVVYDCGHSKHAEYVEDFLKRFPSISELYIVVSHNDSDHTDGVFGLLAWLYHQNKYTVTVYTHQYLKYAEEILNAIHDNRRRREGLKKALLEVFDNIKNVIEAADGFGFFCKEALSGTPIGECVIVGPTKDEFIEVAAKAVDKRESDTIGEGLAQETVMNAASVQLKCSLENGESILLCGDATPDYLKNIQEYSHIQLPHHGQKDDAMAIFEKLGGDAYLKRYLISDNTGSAEKSGGSDDLVKFMKEGEYWPPYNTKNKVIDLPEAHVTTPTVNSNRRFLGELDCV